MEDIFGISIVHDPGQQSDFDLVAVHGIKGHPYNTWTHPNGEKWLEDYLPKDLPNTRIMTFGYNSQIFTSSKGHVNDFAEQLLQHLTSIRRSTGNLERPIIFVCHSLGGLVVKKALLLAQEMHDAAEIRKSTRVVAFMGTPHRGSQLASYAEIAVNCLKAVGAKANAANIHQLKLDSDTLEEIGTQFGSLLQSARIKVLTFYELKTTKIAGITEALVVPHWSAKLGHGPPLETVIPMDSDHRQIAQYPSKNSKQYSVLRSNLVYVTSSDREIILAKDLCPEDMKWNDILLWLNAFRSPPGSTINKVRAQGTCRWIFTKRPFKEWQSSTTSAGLWIHGRPGVGKTVLSTYISETLKRNNDHAILTLYCNSYRSLNDPMYALVRDILHQALQVHPLSEKVKDRLLELKSQTSSMSNIAFETLLDVVEDIFQTNSEMILIIDGIDEIDHSRAEFEAFIHKVNSLSQSSAGCKVLIVSRNIPALERLLTSWNTISISYSDSIHDISLFLDEKLANITHLGHHRAEVAERLVNGSRGLFLWVDLAVGELDHLRTWNEVHALLQNGNRGLDATYATIIQQLDTSSQGFCRIRARALPLVAVACRPFRLEELVELLAVEISKGFIDPGDKLLGGWNTVSRACGPFLQMNEQGVIDLIHVSAKEFLLSHSLAKSLSHDYLIDGSAEAEMACLCLSYLNIMAFGRLPGEVMRPGVAILSEQFPLLEYASTYWSHHFLRSTKISVLQLGLLHQFLNSTCSFRWITAFDRFFSLKRGESHGTILTAQQIILANLQKKLMTAEDVDAVVSKRCIDKCRRILLESTQDSLRIERFYSGPGAQATLEKTLRLVECYCASSEIEVAREVASEAFETAKTAIGPLHPLSLQIERVKLYTQMKCLEKSSSVVPLNMTTDFMRLVQQHVQVYGTDHMETIGCRHDLALIHLSRFEYIEARQILEPLHKRTTEKLGRTSSKTHPIANSLAACANMQGDYDYAESILYTIPGLPEAAAEPLEIDITTVPRQTLHALSILAAVLGAQDEDRKSEVLHQRVIDGFTAQAGPKAWRIYESAINKGQALRDQFKYGEARKHYLEWIKKADQNFGADSPYSRKMRKRLVDVEVRERKWNEMSEGLRSPSAQNPPDLRKLQGYRMGAVIFLLVLVSSIWVCSLC